MRNLKSKEIIVGAMMLMMVVGAFIIVGCNGQNADLVTPGNGEALVAPTAQRPATFYSNGNFSAFGWSVGGICPGQTAPTPTTNFQIWNNATATSNLNDTSNLVNGHSVMSFDVTALPGGQYSGWGAAAFVNPNWCQGAPNDVSNYSGGNFTQCVFWAKANMTITSGSGDISFGAMTLGAVAYGLTTSWQQITLTIPPGDFNGVDTLFYIGFGGTPPYTVYCGDVIFE